MLAPNISIDLSGLAVVPYFMFFFLPAMTVSVLAQLSLALTTWRELNGKRSARAPEDLPPEDALLLRLLTLALLSTAGLICVLAGWIRGVSAGALITASSMVLLCALLWQFGRVARGHAARVLRRLRRSARGRLEIVLWIWAGFGLLWAWPFFFLMVEYSSGGGLAKMLVLAYPIVYSLGALVLRLLGHRITAWFRKRRLLGRRVAASCRSIR